MKTVWARHALLDTGWATDVRISINDDGRIGDIKTGCSAEGYQVGILLPAPVNAHSHAFQRAMAGLTERIGPDPKESFWTWRQLMFRFLDQLTPEQVEAYGVHELHVLENVIRANEQQTVMDVADRIRNKIKWDKGMSEVDLDFLKAYYAALRGRLETRLLFGVRRKDKFDKT